MEQEITSASDAHLTFNLGKEKYSVAVESVKEILEISEVTKVPESPAYMRGIINLRGNILPVVDTRLKLGLEPVEDTRKTRIIVLDIQTEKKSLRVGAIVDRARDVMAVDENEIMPPPSIDDYQRAQYIDGIINHDEEFIMIVDVNKLFAQSELETLANVEDTDFQN